MDHTQPVKSNKGCEPLRFSLPSPEPIETTTFSAWLSIAGKKGEVAVIVQHRGPLTGEQIIRALGLLVTKIELVRAAENKKAGAQ